ncbi:MAG TPA: TIGR02466 family protein [Pseudobdellovibrionaceae bacterium]|nr:TIGR02466 family protein [Pseudobdellovibrionaceae bacterium]
MIHEFFTSMVYQSKVFSRQNHRLNADLLKESLKIQEIDQAGQAWSRKNYVKGFTSYGSLCELHRFSSTFGELELGIRKHVQKYVKSLEYDVQKGELQMSTCWVNIMPPGALHSMHIHPLSVVSGTYYLQVPPKASSIKFEDPRLQAFMACPPRKRGASRKNQAFVSVAPKVGDVVLFESWMRHEVPPNQSEKPRISISFNYDWV